MSRFIALIGATLVLAVASIVPASAQDKPNIVIIWGDDIGQSNVSAYSRGLMGYKTPNIDRVAKEGMMFTDYYAEQSCTPAAPRSSPVNQSFAPASRRWASPAPV
jgi:arylsulfatase